MKTLGIAAVLVLAAVAAGLGFVYSGIYNVAASEPHNGVMRWLLSRTAERSVSVRADDLRVPALDDPHLLRDGARHYAANCQVCHGAPGVEPGEIGRGLTPPPPDLAKQAGEWSPSEVFWIVKHGIKMTGMPAWGASHEDQTLWAVTAFVKALPQMSASEYRDLAPAGTSGGGTGGHGHGHG